MLVSLKNVRLLVWLAVARALPVGDQAASDWAWGWWEFPPYLAGTEAEPPLIVLEDAPLRGAMPLPSPSPIPGDNWVARVPDVPHAWTPRMKRGYLREQKREWDVIAV